jgi:hypothetical protein
MQLHQILDITFETEETISTATLSGRNEVVMLMRSGGVIRYNLEKLEGKYLFSAAVSPGLSYPDGGFDLNAKSTIYTLDDIVVVVNNYKSHGYIDNTSKNIFVRLWRNEFCVEHSNYPIALFKDNNNVPHIIYGVANNHIQIMNLDTCYVLTNAKSVIEQGAEEKHQKFIEQYTELPIQPWPVAYDYFFGKLLLSPNKQKFLSAGWGWGSADKYNIYDIEDFITNNKIAYTHIGYWEHDNRGVCWIDDETVAVLYNPFGESEDGATKESPTEIHHYKITGNNVELTTKTKLESNSSVKCQLYYNKTIDAFVCFSDETGLQLINVDGRKILDDQSVKVKHYNDELGLILCAEDKSISIFEIKPLPE